MLNKCAWFFSLILLGAAIGLPLVIPDNGNARTLGDWGDYVGGFAATIALIWLIVGHYQNQREIRDTKRELQDQAELTQEVVGALTRIASSQQVQAADVLTGAEPIFQHVSSTPAAPGRHWIQIRPTVDTGYLEFLNAGGTVKLTKVESQNDTITAQLERPGIYQNGCRFKVLVKSSGPIVETRGIDIRLFFEDRLKRPGAALITAPRFDASPSIEIDMGLSDNGKSRSIG